MPDDLLDIFDSAMQDGDSQDSVDTLSRNANVHLGEEETTIFDDDGGDDSEVDEDLDIDNDDIDADDDSEVVEDATDEFDFDSIKDKPIKVTVNGETFEVPLAELRNGYMRQADYTRKTQQIAADADTLRWARDMQEAFRVDPVGSVRYLQEQLGLVDETDPFEEIDPEIRPLAAELWRTQQEMAELRARTEQFDQERVNASVRAELESMISKYPDFSAENVLPVALEHGLRMEQAYKLWKADQLVAERETERLAREKAEQAAEKREKARKATRQVSKGSSRVAGKSDDSWKKFDSFEDIFAYEFERSRS